MKNEDTISMEINSDGTAGISFYATTEYGNFVEAEEIVDSGKQNFAEKDFEQELRKGSRMKNIPIGENIRDAIRSIKGK